MLPPDKPKTPSPVEPAADDIFLPAEIIAAFVASGTAWRGQVSGWIAGQDQNGLIVVDLQGIIWADFGNLKSALLSEMELPPNQGLTLHELALPPY